jgi:nucleotide-binding universal stress UspA family protein
VVFGDAVSKIIEIECELGAHLIVMGTRARGTLSRFFTESVAERVLRGSNCPVLLTRRGDGPE